MGVRRSLRQGTTNKRKYEGTIQGVVVVVERGKGGGCDRHFQNSGLGLD